jgi:hypothetical protein
MVARVGSGLAAAVVVLAPLGKIQTIATGRLAAMGATSYQRGLRLHPLEMAVITPAVVALATLPDLTLVQTGSAALVAAAMAGINPVVQMCLGRRGQLIPAVAAGRTLTIIRQEQARQEDLESSLSGILERPAPLAAR